MEEIEYVSDYRPPPPPPPPPPLARVGARGAGLGALGGFAFLGWETAVTGWLGMQPAAGVRPLTMLLLYLATGALFGGLATLPRLAGGAWMLFTAALAAAWLLSGHVGLLMGDGNAWFAVPALFVAAVVLGYYAGARRLEDPTAGAVAVALTLSLATLLPVNAHLLLTPMSTSGLMWNFGTGVLAAAVGALTGMVLSDGVVGVLGVLCAGAAVPWLVATPVLHPSSAPWPVGREDVGPPLVLIVTSGMRADRLGIYGYDRPTTPNLDAFAARALVYSDATANAPWTLPSMASLLTGRLPSHHEVGAPRRGYREPLGETVPYLPQILQRRGYVTAAITTHRFMGAPFGFARGFAAYDDLTGPAVMPAGVHPWEALGVGPRWPKQRDATTVTNRAISFVQAPHGGSWFLLVHYADPARFGRASAEALAELGATRGSAGDDYDAAIRRLDAELARLLAALPPEAIVVLTSAHGIELGERRVADAPPDTPWGHALYQEQVRVPLVVAGPGLGPSWVTRPVPLTDVAPTLAVLGGAPADRLDGAMLWEVSHGDEPPPERAMVVELPRAGADAKAARRGRYKLMVTREGGERLYDLQLDPLERSPIIERSAEVQATIRELAALIPPFKD